MRQVVIGPVLMDFTWNLMRFNPYARWSVNRYPREKVVVICRKGEEYLWEDIATEFDYCKGKYSTEKWLFHRNPVELSRKLRKRHGVKLRMAGNTIIVPNSRNCARNASKQFRSFRTDYEVRGYDIVFHARASVKYGTRDHNWPIWNYGALMDLIPNLDCCSIGIEAHHIPGTEDLREIPLSQLADVMSNSTLFVGPISGPSYFAALCGMKTFCWGKGEHGQRFLYRQKVFPETPHGFKTWKPSPMDVVKRIKQCLIHQKM